MLRRSVAALLSAVLLVVIATAPLAHATVFQAEGGMGDAAEQYLCPSGTVLVGFVGRAGAWLDQIGLMCSQVLGDYSTGGVTAPPPKGGNGGSPNQQYCERDAAIRSIKIAIVDVGEFGHHYYPKYVEAIEFSCVRPKDGAPVDGHAFSGIFVTTEYDELEPGTNNQSCPANEYATGLNIRYGKHVNAVGLICGNIDPPRIQVIIPPNLGGSKPSQPSPPTQPAPPGPGSWSKTGTFDTNLGMLVLTGNEGYYSPLNGRVTVTKISGDRMEGIWSTSWSTQRCADGGYHGTFLFYMGPDGFVGKYGFCSGPTNAGDWIGKRL